MILVLDSSAFIAFPDCEPGEDMVLEAFPDSVISVANFSEVAAKLADRRDRG